MNLVLNVLVGGVDTTQWQLAHALRLFAATPTSGALLAERRSWRRAAVEEVVRYEPITPFTARLLHEDVEYRDVTFPAEHGRDGVRRSRATATAWTATPRRSTSPPTAATPSRSRSAPASTTAWARTSPAPSSRRRSRSCPRACPGWRSTASRARLGPRHLRPGQPADGWSWRSALPDRLRDRPGELARWPRSAASSRWFAEHTHIPASRETPYPGGGELPHEYCHTHDPFVALPAARRHGADQARHRRLPRDRARPDRHGQGGRVARPLSGGRFLFGVGAGWNLEEMSNHGTDPRGPLRAHARARRGDEGDLDRGRGRVPRRVRRLRSDLVLAEAGAAAAPADPGRRQRPEGARPRAGLRRRVDAQPLRSPEELSERIAELRERAGRHVPVASSASSPSASGRALAWAGRGPPASSTSRPTPTRARSSASWTSSRRWR